MDRKEMWAAVLTRPGPVRSEPLVVTRVPQPVPRADEVLIEVETCGVCRTDLHVVEGDLPDTPLPMIPGHQVVGRVVLRGAAVERPRVGRRVGLGWLQRTCEACDFCRSERENLCVAPTLTGWKVPGGFAEFVTAPADFVHELPDDADPITTAPLLCAGIIGYRCLRLTELTGRWPGAAIGIYGFGAAGHIAIQIAKSRGAEVYVCTRDVRHQVLARELGAQWVGDADAPPPVALDAAIIFAPAGELVPAGLRALAPGGTLVLGGIHMSDIPRFPYDLLYRERSIRSVTNNTRADAREFLAEAARANVSTHVETFRLAEINRALAALAHDAIRGAAVIDLRLGLPG